MDLLLILQREAELGQEGEVVGWASKEVLPHVVDRQLGRQGRARAREQTLNGSLQGVQAFRLGAGDQDVGHPPFHCVHDRVKRSRRPKVVVQAPVATTKGVPGTEPAQQFAGSRTTPLDVDPDRHFVERRFPDRVRRASQPRGGDIADTVHIGQLVFMGQDLAHCVPTGPLQGPKPKASGGHVLQPLDRHLIDQSLSFGVSQGDARLATVGLE